MEPLPVLFANQAPGASRTPACVACAALGPMLAQIRAARAQRALWGRFRTSLQVYARYVNLEPGVNRMPACVACVAQAHMLALIRAVHAPCVLQVLLQTSQEHPSALYALQVRRTIQQGLDVFHALQVHSPATTRAARARRAPLARSQT